ncbi:HTH domain-containing protein [Streptomyces netropsis]|nr:HTH domain-containing protein [Streptomyces netropsis]
MKFLRTREKGSTKSLAARLGVSRKTVQRYLRPLDVGLLRG